jgi:aryl-alcohol dehydrogenase (NADP+)
MIPLCREMGVALIPWSPLARGFLVGNRTPDDITVGETPRAKSVELARRLYYRDEDFDIVDRLSELASKRGESNARVGYAWLLQAG